MSTNNEPSGSFQFRDYQLDALQSIFSLFGIVPAGPSDDPVVSRCCSHRTREDSDHGRLGESLAAREGDDVIAPF